MQKQFPGDAVPVEGVLWMYCGFWGAYLCVGVILSCEAAFVEIVLLHCGSPVGLLHVFRAPFLESTSGGLLLNDDNFIYRF